MISLWGSTAGQATIMASRERWNETRMREWRRTDAQVMYKKVSEAIAHAAAKEAFVSAKRCSTRANGALT